MAKNYSPAKTHQKPSKTGYTVPRSATFKKSGKRMPAHQTHGGKSKSQS